MALPDALLFTSAHAPAMVAHHEALKAVPAWAVGGTTALAARRAGFHVAGRGDRDGSAIVAAAAAAGVTSMWHIGGADRAPMVVPDGLRIMPHAVYAAELAGRLPDRAVSMLRAGRVLATLLFSARAAAHFGALVDAAQLPRTGLRLVGLSPAVARAAGPGWSVIAIARAPSMDAVFAAAERLWQEFGHDRTT